MWAVADMDKAKAAFERLGFNIPGLGRHLEWGTGNWCMFFEEDYLELRGILAPDRYLHGLEAYLEENGEGLMGLAFGTDSAEASRQSLMEGRLHPHELKSLRRNLEWDGGKVQPEFRLCFLPPEETACLGSVVFCEHRTPELLRRPEWVQHRNACTGVLGMRTACSRERLDPEAYRALFGEAAIESLPDRLRVNFPRNQYLELFLPGSSSSGALNEVILQSENMQRTRDCLRSADVNFSEQEDDILVGPESACGATLHFCPQP